MYIYICELKYSNLTQKYNLLSGQWPELPRSLLLIEINEIETRFTGKYGYIIPTVTIYVLIVMLSNLLVHF